MKELLSERELTPDRVGQVSLFGTWLAETAELQATAYDYDPREAWDNKYDGGELRWLEYVREQTLAAFIELGEFLQELSWKPWALQKHFPNTLAREAALMELIDVLHFVANDLSALGVTDEELSARYLEKMAVNRARMASGGHRT